MAKRNIGQQINKGSFPILAYSYYEYGEELKEGDLYSALLYAEYALELSNLDMYFVPVNGHREVDFDVEPLIFLAIGVMIGVVAAIMLIPKKRKRKRA